jgi:hypothetical protein
MSNNNPTGPGELAEPAPEGHFPALHFDAAEYQRFVDDSDLSPAQQQELLEALWVIIVGFVDLGFHVHPVQMALDVNNNRAAVAPGSQAVLACKQSFSKQAKLCRALPRPRGRRGDS